MGPQNRHEVVSGDLPSPEDPQVGLPVDGEKGTFLETSLGPAFLPPLDHLSDHPVQACHARLQVPAKGRLPASIREQE